MTRADSTVSTRESESVTRLATLLLRRGNTWRMSCSCCRSCRCSDTSCWAAGRSAKVLLVRLRTAAPLLMQRCLAEGDGPAASAGPESHCLNTDHQSLAACSALQLTLNPSLLRPAVPFSWQEERRPNNTDNHSPAAGCTLQLKWQAAPPITQFLAGGCPFKLALIKNSDILKH